MRSQRRRPRRLPPNLLAHTSPEPIPTQTLPFAALRLFSILQQLSIQLMRGFYDSYSTRTSIPLGVVMWALLTCSGPVNHLSRGNLMLSDGLCGCLLMLLQWLVFGVIYQFFMTIIKELADPITLPGEILTSSCMLLCRFP